MPIVVKRIPGLNSSRALALQIAACGLLAWAWYRSEPAPAPEPPASRQGASAPAVAEKPAGESAADVAADRQMPQSAEDAEAREAAAETSNAGLSFSTIEVVVGRNDTLERIFRRLELDLADLASLRQLPDLRAKLDRLYPGEALTVRRRGAELVGLERRLSASETLQVRRESEGFAADVLENPLEVELRTARGVIRSSLFHAANEAGISDQTALDLAELFGWDIDFVLDIQPGDEFVITYEQLSQDGEFVKDGAILAAKFVNQGREFRAVRYVDPDGRAGYYTPEGRSLRKAFLRAPLQFTRVSSRFNPYRRHPVLNTIRAHKGVDYAAPIGTPVRAAGEGRVRFAGRKGGYGNVVEIAHSRGVVTLYGHLHRFAKGIRSGKRVNQGQVIGYVGMSGLATGPHLHYEYHLNGVHKNPQTVKLPTAQPIAEALRADFLAKTAQPLASLEPAGPASLVAR